MPWFYHKLPKGEIGNVEVRMCRDQNFNDEDLTVDFMCTKQPTGFSSMHNSLFVPEHNLGY